MPVRFSKLIALLAVALMVFAACGDDSDTGTDAGADDAGQEQPAGSQDEPTKALAEEATFTAVDFDFQGPDSVPAGNVSLTLENEGTESHEMVVVQLLQGKTLEDELVYIERHGTEGEHSPWTEFAGVIRPVRPGETGQGGVPLEPGNYALLCFVESKENDGQPHVELGMAAPLTVE